MEWCANKKRIPWIRNPHQMGYPNNFIHILFNILKMIQKCCRFARSQAFLSVKKNKPQKYVISHILSRGSHEKTDIWWSIIFMVLKSHQKFLFNFNLPSCFQNTTTSIKSIDFLNTNSTKMLVGNTFLADVEYEYPDTHLYGTSIMFSIIFALRSQNEQKNWIAWMQLKCDAKSWFFHPLTFIYK